MQLSVTPEQKEIVIRIGALKAAMDYFQMSVDLDGLSMTEVDHMLPSIVSDFERYIRYGEWPLKYRNE
jgi:hypothetical protein